MIDIKRRTELHIVNRLKALVPNHNFVPYSGGNESTDAAEIEPPFTVVSVLDANRTMATEGTWICEGIVQVISHSKETTSTAQSTLTRSIYVALSNLPPYVDGEFAFHGIDIVDMGTAQDDESQAHADVIRFTAGVGG